MENDSIIDSRNAKASAIFSNPKIIFPIILILLIILGVYIRALPMTDHNGLPGLWDHSKNAWTLGPDLDPWSFVKNAKIIAQGSGIPAIDTLRNVPLGVDNSRETILLPYMIYGTYQLVNLFGTFNMEFAGALFPVIMFGLTIIAFFLFTREIFLHSGKTKANIIASISTFFFTITPALLHRTVAGIPEKESAGFLFMFLAFYLFLKSIKAGNIKSAILYGFLAGAATTIMRFIWGGAVYIFGAIFMAVLLSFLFNKVNSKYYAAYSSWLITTCLTMVMFSSWFTLGGLLVLSYTSVCILLWFFLTLHIILWNTRLSNIGFMNTLKQKLPKNIISIIISLILLIPISLIIFGPDFIYGKLKIIYELLFNPITGRWNTTVAENRPPFLGEWMGNFGPFIGNLPVMFTLFITGSVVLFKEALTNLKKKDSVRLTIIYLILLMGITFSRIASTSIFNGQNFISKLLTFAEIQHILTILLNHNHL